MEALPYEEFVDSLTRLGGTVTVAPEILASILHAAEQLQDLQAVDVGSLAALIEEHPDWVPYLALCVGLSQEQLKNILRHRLGSSGWVTLARKRSDEVIKLLDEDFGLVERISSERSRSWTFGDVLAERYSSRSRAAGAAGRGRGVEDQVEAIVRDLGLAYQMRGRYVGRDGRDAPCDLAIPGAGPEAAIVCAMKGFDSTGSKLTDAVTEVQQMAHARLPRQFLFVIVDGIGWLSRQSDLRRIHALSEAQSIDGLYNLSMLGQFRADLEEAARRIGLLS